MYGKLLKQYIGLIDYINRKGKVTLSNLRASYEIEMLYEHEIPARTFHRHRIEIAEIFGIDIDCDKSDDSYSITNKNDLQTNTVQNWLIDSWSLSNLITNSRTLHNRILLEEAPSGQLFLLTIIEAMKNNHKISFMYHFYEYESMPKTVKPLYVKVFKQRWYLIALNEDEVERVFGLDRMADVTETNKTFDLPKDLDPQGRFVENYGVTIGDKIKTETIVVKVDKFQRNYLRDLPLHGSQNELETQEEYSLFEFRLKPTIEFIMEMLSYGEKVEILEPSSLRDKFAEKFGILNKTYNTTN